MTVFKQSTFVFSVACLIEYVLEIGIFLFLAHLDYFCFCLLAMCRWDFACVRGLLTLDIRDIIIIKNEDILFCNKRFLCKEKTSFIVCICRFVYTSWYLILLYLKFILCSMQCANLYRMTVREYDEGDNFMTVFIGRVQFF